MTDHIDDALSKGFTSQDTHRDALNDLLIEQQREWEAEQQ